jgi:hypothetical protein
MSCPPLRRTLPLENSCFTKVSSRLPAKPAMQPYPRDFTCFQTMKEISDGQMFWIIKHGSHGTRMKLFKDLEEDQIWQLVHYVRRFAD